ncbi:MAG TPA: hydantoinase/oxoprolinase family protein, partial [Geminicoccaceae bacterium]|nr:hydantoinase/oxoprolinase family protein [Geminicoccaceae bacterium]
MSAPARRPWRIGIDVGGTFTDGVALNEATGALVTAKVLSTPDDPGRAFLTAAARLVERTGAPAEAVSLLVHGTTVATNAVLQRRLAPTAFITTRGFGDLLEIARQVRPDPYDVFTRKPAALVPRWLCFEVDERIGAEGDVVTPLDEGSVAAALDELSAADIQAVAVCLLHAYRNPAHERRVAELVQARLPDVALTISSDLASEFREFPRACTAVINAGLMPELGRYLGRLDGELAAAGFFGPRLVMQSNGGVADFAHSAGRPVFMIESGPAAGAVAAAHVAAALGERDVISFDMGGTTAKVGLIQGGAPATTHEFEIGTDANLSRSWFTGASGHPILTPALDLIEIGAGGGSLAWIDDGGKLRVGPRSAGSVPGPACYGLGGERATVTDADLVLGRLNPAYFSGGEIALDPRAARDAVAPLSTHLGLDEAATAAGIIRIADAAMSRALRLVSVQRGKDPRGFKLVAFGGAGPLHAVALAAEAGIGTVLVPPRPGLFSAFGLLTADLRHDFATTVVGRLLDMDAAILEAVFAELAARGRAVLEGEGVGPADMRVERTLDVRYVGQSCYLSVGIDDPAITAGTLRDVARRFNRQHLATYG